MIITRSHLGLIVSLCWVYSVSAQTDVPLAYQHIARLARVPAHYFYGMALHESGKKITQQTIRPWPWTLNVEGQSYFYPTRHACWRALTQYLKQGKQRIDIGLMQINWQYHRKTLQTPWQALDPYFNLQVGATILHREYDKTHNWLLAIGRYHSPGQQDVQKQRALNYAKQVLRRLDTLRQAS